jgi:hypothetical protein
VSKSEAALGSSSLGDRKTVANNPLRPATTPQFFSTAHTFSLVMSTNRVERVREPSGIYAPGVADGEFSCSPVANTGNGQGSSAMLYCAQQGPNLPGGGPSVGQGNNFKFAAGDFQAALINEATFSPFTYSSSSRLPRSLKKHGCHQTIGKPQSNKRFPYQLTNTACQ